MTTAQKAVLAVNILITATTSIIARYSMGLMDPIPFAVLSLGVAAIPLLAADFRAGRLSLLWSKGSLGPFLALGLFGTALPSLLLFYAGRTVPASRIVVLAQVEILISMMTGALFLNEKIGRRQFAATALILCGMLIALGAGSVKSLGPGELMILAMPPCFQLSHIFGKRLLPGAGVCLVAGGRTLYGMLLLLPLVPFLAPAASWDRCRAPQALSLILFQGLVTTALSLRLWYTSLAELDLSKLTTLLLTYPLVTLFLSRALPFLNEPVGPGQFLGAALVLAGGGLMSRLPSQETAPLKPAAQF